jgi:hypothetical protein
MCVRVCVCLRACVRARLRVRVRGILIALKRSNLMRVEYQMGIYKFKIFKIN